MDKCLLLSDAGRAMSRTCLSSKPLIAALALLPSLAACGSSAPDGPPPPSAASLEALSDDPGAPDEQLARAIDVLFDDEEAVGDTRALVVMHAGQVAAERYGADYRPDTRFVSWSMAKSVTAVLIGMLVADGKLALDDPVPLPNWRRPGDPRGEITLRHLLQMRSGLRHTEAGDPIFESDEVRMLFLDGRDDMAAYAEAQPLEAEAGAKFEYSSATSVVLADLAARALAPEGNANARADAVSAYLSERLFDPLGMDSAVPEFDAAGTLIGGSLIHATARDWARFGEFLRNGGSHRGSQLVPRSWIEAMTSASPRSPDYGFQLWLDSGEAEGRDVLFGGKSAPGTVAAVGHLGQYILVSPRQKLTVVRLGKSTSEQRPELVEALGELMDLYPAG